MKISVIMPVYNEAQTIEEIVRRVLASPYETELILVDDASTDGTREKLAELAASGGGRIKVLLHEKNRGKGAALATGVPAAAGDIVIVQDADLEYDPRDYPRLVEPIADGSADVVVGSRFVGGDSHRVLYFWHYVGNRFLTLLSNCFTNLNMTDMECGYKAFRREVIQSLTIEEARFGFEPEIVAKVAARRLRVYEAGVSYHGRTYEEGKKIRARDGLRAVWCILKYNLRG